MTENTLRGESSALTATILEERTLVKICPAADCNYKTLIATNMKNHFRKHTGEKPFKCHLCPYRAVQKGNVKRHIVVHHP